MERTSEIITPDYIDSQMLKAREATKSAMDKILASHTEHRTEHLEKITHLKTSVY